VIEIVKRYYELCQQNQWEVDPQQLKALHILAELIPTQRSWFSKLRNTFLKQSSCYGVYLYGAVGRGKTLMMDLFFEQIQIHKKQRWHFVEFMALVHQKLKTMANCKHRQQPIELVVKDLANRAELICLDELEVTEIADAMLLSRLFTRLAELGVQVVFTANLAPEQLYLKGLHYDRFKPFVTFIQKHFKVFYLNNQANQDYRIRSRAPQQCYLTRMDPDAKSILEKLFTQLTGTTVTHPVVLHVNHRELKIAKVAKEAAWISFHDLCGVALGPSDYLALAHSFKILFLIDVPILTDNHKNEARRFISLIDTWYDQNRLLVAYLDADIDSLFAISDPAIPMVRTLSRLKEMQTMEYWSASE
jgi:cell division protein ZapE